MKIKFADLKVGQYFFCDTPQRAFGGIKTLPCNFQTPELFARNCIEQANALILTDHVGEVACDAGHFVLIRDEQIVEVTETVPSE